jgi:hypothetical protein
MPNGGPLSNADKGIVYKLCYPATTTDFNKIRLYKLQIMDQFGSDECSGTVKVIPDLSGELLEPVIHFVIPNTGEYVTLGKDAEAEKIDQPVQFSSDFTLVPNPGTDALQVNWTALTDERVTVRIADISGRTALTQHVESIAGENMLLFDMSARTEGIYIVILQTERNVQALKWVKD